MKKRLIKTIPFENGELFATIETSRFLLASCTPKVEIYEQSVSIPTLGSGCKVKETRLVIVLCGNMDYTRDVDVAFLQNVLRFELCADIQRPDGVFEKIIFSTMKADEIDLTGNEWRFEAMVRPELMRKLLP